MVRVGTAAVKRAAQRSAGLSPASRIQGRLQHMVRQQADQGVGAVDEAAAAAPARLKAIWRTHPPGC